MTVKLLTYYSRYFQCNTEIVIRDSNFKTFFNLKYTNKRHNFVIIGVNSINYTLKF